MVIKSSIFYLKITDEYLNISNEPGHDKTNNRFREFGDFELSPVLYRLARMLKFCMKQV